MGDLKLISFSFSLFCFGHMDTYAARGVVLPSAPLLGVTGAGAAHAPAVDEVDDAHESAAACQSADSVLERAPAPVLAALPEEEEEAQGSGTVSHSLPGARERDPDDLSSPPC